MYYIQSCSKLKRKTSQVTKAVVCRSCNIIKKKTLAQVKNTFKNTFFSRTPSANHSNIEFINRNYKISILIPFSCTLKPWKIVVYLCLLICSTIQQMTFICQKMNCWKFKFVFSNMRFIFFLGSTKPKNVCIKITTFFKRRVSIILWSFWERS